MNKFYIKNVKQIDFYADISTSLFKIMLYPANSTDLDIICFDISEGTLKLTKRVSNKWSVIYTWKHS